MRARHRRRDSRYRPTQFLMEMRRRFGLIGMQHSLCMQTKYPSLTREDCALMLANLDESLAVFERKSTVLSASELRVKSLLSALRYELLLHHTRLADEMEGHDRQG